MALLDTVGVWFVPEWVWLIALKNGAWLYSKRGRDSLLRASWFFTEMCSPICRPTISSMMEGSVPRKTLRDGFAIPMLGLGTYMTGGEAVSWALQAGYRLIDTASLYQ